MSQQQRPFMRLLLTVLAGLVGGLAGVTGMFWVVAAIALQDGPAVIVSVMGAFFGCAALAVLSVARATAGWAAPQLGAGKSGLALGAGSGLALGAGNELPLSAANELPLSAGSGPALAAGSGPALGAGARVATSDELVRFVRSPPSTQLPPAFILVASFVAYLFVSGGGESLAHALVLAGVIAVHEGGHALAMKLFGYRDVRVFFVPFVGGATTAKPNAGARWREGVVLLMGPIPGIGLGACLALFSSGDATAIVIYTARMLVLVNAFNLLPVLPLDGGRLLELVFFSRHRFAELGFRVVSTAGLAWFALAGKDVVLGILAYLQGIGVFGGWAVATVAARYANASVPVPQRIEDTSAELIDDVNQHLSWQWGSRSNRGRASWIRLVVERAMNAKRAPGVAGSLALALCWVLSVAFAFVAAVATFQLIE